MKVSRREMYSVLLVLMLASAIALSFPLSALSFRPHNSNMTHEASAAFVVLTEEERATALKAAKTAWQSDATESRGLSIRLPLGELPDEEQGALLRDEDIPCGTIPFKPISPRLPAWLPSQKASPPTHLAPEPEDEKPPAFSREEMLKM